MTRDATLSRPELVLMRGLPSCGKSTTAKKLAADGGVAVEFDAFFETPLESGGKRFHWSRGRLPEARRWFLGQVLDAMERRKSPIVADNDCGATKLTRALVLHALFRGYSVRVAEPESPWWPTVRRLLRDKRTHAVELDRWAHKLAVLSKSTHRVSYESFRRRMARWEPELSLASVLTES